MRLLLPTVLVLLIAVPASAQPPLAAQSQSKSTSSGFFIGLGAEGTGVVTPATTIRNTTFSATTEAGPGLGLVIGYGFSPRWSIYIQGSAANVTGESFGIWSGTNSGDYSLIHGDLGVRVHFREASDRVRPFLQLGLSERSESGSYPTGTATASGLGALFGGGLNVHFNPELAYTASVTWTVGSISNYLIQNVALLGSANVTDARVQLLGITWFPGAH